MSLSPIIPSFSYNYCMNKGQAITIFTSNSIQKQQKQYTFNNQLNILLKSHSQKKFDFCSAYKIRFAQAVTLINSNDRQQVVIQRNNMIMQKGQPVQLTSPHLSKSQNKQFKQRYEEYKHSVTVFARKVEEEISIILQNQAQQKRKLRSEIQALKKQLKEKDKISETACKNSSLKKNSTQRQISTVSEAKYRSSTSTINQTSQSCKKIASEGKLNFEEQQNLTQISINSKKILNYEKENQKFIFKHDKIQISENHQKRNRGPSSISSLRRQRRLKQMKRQQKGEKVQEIKDLLKSLRENLEQDQKNRLFKQHQEPVLTVVTPQMFNASWKHRN